MASKKLKQEPVRWVTIRGKHFPVMPDGTLGFGREDDEVDDKIKSKADTLPNYVTKNKDDEIVGSSEHYDIKASSHSPIVRRGSGTGFGKRKTQYELFNKDGTSVERNADDYSIEGYGYSTLKQATEEVNKLEYLKDVMKASKPVSRNARYDTSRANNKTKSTSTKKKPTALEAFKENSNQMINALKEGQRQNALEVHYTDMTGKTYKHYWNGVKFTTDKVKQDMAKKYGKKAGIYKASFKKPKEWE